MTRNVSEKSINNILDYVGGEGKVHCLPIIQLTHMLTMGWIWLQHAALAPEISIETLEAFYSATMQVLDEQRNEVGMNWTIQASCC